MKRKMLLIGGAALAVAVIAAVVGLRGRGDDALEVQTARVGRQRIVQKVTATGRIEPRTQIKISADVSAKIRRLAVKEGQWVPKGALLVELDRERYLASVESAEAAVRSAEANATLVKQNRDMAGKELARAKELRERDLQSQSDFDTRQTAERVESARYAAALEQVAQAKAALKQARDDLSKTTIYAPMAGTVSALNKEEGEIALGSQFQADVILVIADLREMEAQVAVDENDITSIQPGQAAEIEADALLDHRLAGAVREIGSSATATGSGTSEQKTEFQIKVGIASPPPTLRPGMSASAEIVTKTRDAALCVPLQSVALRTADQLGKAGRKAKAPTYTPDRDGFVEVVFCVNAGRVEARQVRTGIQSDDMIEILDGLREGDTVVTGSYRAISKDLRNGSAVKVDNSKKPERARPAAANA